MGGARTFQWHWPAALITLLAALAGAWLGHWQLSRADEKQLLLTTMAARADAAPVSPTALLSRDDPGYFPVQVRGHFDNRRGILLDNRILDGVAGYHLLSPFQSVDGHWYLVNRGWLPRGRDRAQLPAIPALTGEHTVRGRSYRYSDRTFTLAEDDLKQPDWPVRVQKVEMRAIGEVLGVELAPFEIRVEPGLALEAGEQLPRPWQDATEGILGPERHRAYALQWFSLAALAVVVFVAASFRKTD